MLLEGKKPLVAHVCLVVISYSNLTNKSLISSTSAICQVKLAVEAHEFILFMSLSEQFVLVRKGIDSLWKHRAKNLILLKT